LPEKSGTVTNTNRQVQMGRPAVPPPGEAREDWAITTDLANRMGLDWRYDGPADVFAEMKRNMRSLDNITWERLEARARSPIRRSRPRTRGRRSCSATASPGPAGARGSPRQAWCRRMICPMRTSR
jgi:formate dehydrogenase major subunit